MTAADIIALINQHPQGLTSAQAAAITGMKTNTLATRLSKLANYGKIARMTVAREKRGGMFSTWMPKQNGAAP